MTDSVHERDVLDLLSAITEIVDSEPDLGQRARLLGVLRAALDEQLDHRLFRLVHDLSESGWTQQEIADSVCLSRLTVGIWLRRYKDNHGIPRRDQRLEDDLANAIILRSGYKPG